MVLENFEVNLQKYAKLLVSTGINVQPGHTVVIYAEVEQAPFARLLVKEAYQLGASEVIVQWSDDEINRDRLLYAAEERITTVPEYKVQEMHYLLDHKASRLSIVSKDPDALNGVDTNRLAKAMKASSVALKPMRVATQSNKVSWTVAAAAGSAWAKKVFPEATSTEEAVDLLWNQIFTTCRVYADDPVAAWKEHEEKIRQKKQLF